MGVKKLWGLLSAVGRPITLESLEGVRLAIDTSIWLYQLQMGMGDKGETMENAYLKALFHRICKLLFFNIRPGTPLLKMKTVAARRKRKLNEQRDIKKTAETLFRTRYPEISLAGTAPRKKRKKESIDGKGDKQELRVAESWTTEPLRALSKPIQPSSAVGSSIDLSVFESLPEDIKEEILSEMGQFQKSLPKRPSLQTPAAFSQQQVQSAVENGKRSLQERKKAAQKPEERQTIASDPNKEFELVLEDIDSPSSPVYPTSSYTEEEEADGNGRDSGAGFLLSSSDEESEIGDEDKAWESFETQQISSLPASFEQEEEGVLDISIDISDIDPAVCLFDESFFETGPKQPSPKQPETLQERSRSTSSNDGIPSFVSDIDALLQKEAAILSQAGRPTVDSVGSLSTELQQACTELLRLFGIPWVQSPMEAEAQCGELIQQGLVDGVATEDSDAFLVGADVVYRYLFNKEKHVEIYKLKDIQRTLGLSRNKLIDLALLLGSDYTPGIKGVGIVSAMEILSEFASLSEFREWWASQTDAAESNPKRKQMEWMKHKLLLPADFPQQDIIDAYLRPTVDTSSEKFEWARPDLDGLRRFAFERFGWTQEHVDEILLPILKNYQEVSSDDKKKQTKLEAHGFFMPKATATIKSIRVHNAISALQGQRADQNNVGSTTRRKQKGGKEK